MYSVFETEVVIRPDDIDLNNHVHSSRYMDFLLFARFDQMRNCYKMSMEEFWERGLNWVYTASYAEFKRAAKLGDKIAVRTQIESVEGAQVKINYWIVFKETGKTAVQGYAMYTLLSLTSGRPVRIPDDIIERYSI